MDSHAEHLSSFRRAAADLNLPSGDPEKAFDVWTPVHVLSGIVLGGLGANRVTAYSLILGVEFIEFMFRRSGSEFFDESSLNVFSDIAVGIAAYEATRAFK